MGVQTKKIEFSTQGNSEATDITGLLNEVLAEIPFKNGICTVFIPGSTGGLTTIEYENGLLRDLKNLWERIAPRNEHYHHDEAWKDGNGHSHIRASLVGPSLTIPFCGRQFTLGTWQQIIFIDFDTSPRNRQLVAQFMGE